MSQRYSWQAKIEFKLIVKFTTLAYWQAQGGSFQRKVGDVSW